MRAAEFAIHLLLLLAFPPILLGVINKTKAAFAGRVGAPLLQPYHDLLKLFRKGLVLSETTTWVFTLAPAAALLAVILAGMLLPAGPLDAPIRFTGDMILFVYLLGLARFLIASAALDTGSSFEGMGAAREVSFACLAEGAVLFAFLVLAKNSGALALSSMLRGVEEVEWGIAAAPLLLISAGLFIVVLAENCRVPFDDPNTHLELTMIHEVMVLDHGGPLLGLILYGAAIKLYILGALLVQVLIPFDNIGPGGAPVFVAGLLGLAVAIGVVESIMARLQLRHIPYLLTAATLFCAFGFLLVTR